MALLLKKSFFGLVFIFSLVSGLTIPHGLRDLKESLPAIQPIPKVVDNLNHFIIQKSNFLKIIALNREEQKAAAYFKYQFSKKISSKFKFTGNSKNNLVRNVWSVKFQLINSSENIPNEQYYSIICLREKKEICIRSQSQLGLLYGGTTLLKCFAPYGNSVKICLFNVTDYPTYTKRMFGSNISSQNVKDVLHFALQNKFETIAVNIPPHRIVNENNSIWKKIWKWKEKYGGPKTMQVCFIRDENDTEKLKKTIETGLKYGIDKLMLFSEDTTYQVTGEEKNSKERHFIEIAKRDCSIVNDIYNWIKIKKYNLEIYFLPYVNSFEDTINGYLTDYKNTPWENEFLTPINKNIDYTVNNIPKEVFILWTRPFSFSVNRSGADFGNWISELGSRIPFLLDNSINNESEVMFSAWDNKLPKNFSLNTAGNGMFINCDISKEALKAAAITANDFMWNPEGYSPVKSLESALNILYGAKSAELLKQFNEADVSLRRKINERQLWYEADSLWAIVRKIRFITEKNPWYYQQIYNRFKALRMQLKNSVPIPEPINEFETSCKALHMKIKDILDQLKKINSKLYLEIEKYHTNYRI